jgi:hypothetical protein
MCDKVNLFAGLTSWNKNVYPLFFQSMESNGPSLLSDEIPVGAI